MGDIASAAIRGARMNIDMEEFADDVFPVFVRRRGENGDDAFDEDESDGMHEVRSGQWFGFAMCYC